MLSSSSDSEQSAPLPCPPTTTFAGDISAPKLTFRFGAEMKAAGMKGGATKGGAMKGGVLKGSAMKAGAMKGGAMKGGALMGGALKAGYFVGRQP
jgi:hypothetical protein